MSRHSLPLTPVSSPPGLRPPLVGQPPQAAQTDDQAQKALCRFDAHLMSLVPNWKPMNEQELREAMFRRGATDATLDDYLKCYDLVTKDFIQTCGFRVMGVKPLPGDPNVYTVPVPDSPYVLRMWDGGMDSYGHFCLDFFDLERNAPVNLPAGHGLYPGAAAGIMPFGAVVHPPPNQHTLRAAPAPAPAAVILNSRRPLEAFGSWERNMGIHAFPDGEEKWSFPEGTCVVLRRGGHPDLPFQVPVRQQATYGVQVLKGYPQRMR